MAEVTRQEVRDEVHETVKQFFDRHRDELKTYGDAMGWIQDADYEDMRREAGCLGTSKFSTEIIWLTGMFGPLAEIDFEALKPQSRKLVLDALPPEPDEDVKEPEKKKRGRPRKLADVVVVEDAPEQEMEPRPRPAVRRPTRRRAGRIPPGAFEE